MTSFISRRYRMAAKDCETMANTREIPDNDRPLAAILSRNNLLDLLRFEDD